LTAKGLSGDLLSYVFKKGALGVLASTHIVASLLLFKGEACPGYHYCCQSKNWIGNARLAKERLGIVRSISVSKHSLRVSEVFIKKS